MNTRFTGNSMIRFVGGTAALGLLVASAAFAFTGGTYQSALAGVQDDDPEMHVGTYDPQRAFQSYHGFQEFSAKMQELQRQQAEAQQQGDQPRVMEIQNELQRRQDNTIQKFYNAVESAIPDVASKNDIHVVALEVIWVSPDMAASRDMTRDIIERINENAQPQQREQVPGFPQ